MNNVKKILLFGVIVFCTGICADEIPNNEIWYTSDTDAEITLHVNVRACFGANIVSHTYVDGKGVIIFDGDVTSIGYCAFRDIPMLTGITIPHSVDSIGDSAFNACYRLTDIKIPDSVISIGEGAFYNCKGLTSIIIPGSVTNIGKLAFCLCENLETIEVEPENCKYDSRGGCNAIVETSSNTLICGCMTTVVPNSVTTVGESAFYGNRRLTSISISNSVIEIGNASFAGCSELTELTIGNGLTRIGNNAFAECPGLTNVTIPNSVTEIGECAFAGCAGLTSITIPYAVNSIAQGAFSLCDNLETIEVEPENCKYDSRDGCNAIVETSSNTLVCGCLTTVVPNSVTTIGEYAFYGNRRLTGISIPNSVCCIEGSAFGKCTGLTSVSIPNSVTEIGDAAFAGCSGLTNLTIGNGLTRIGNNAFAECSGLTNVTISNSVTEIGEDVFFGCKGLTSVVIPCGVESIGSMAFGRCTSLLRIELPQSLTDIGINAFVEDETLIDVVNLSPVPQKISSQFPSRFHATLHVPEGCAEAYRSAEIWRDFANIVEDAATSVNQVAADDGHSGDTPWFDLSGRRVDSPSSGIYIRGGHKVLLGE